MANIQQFRCPGCIKLLLKYDKAKDELIFQAPDVLSRKEDKIMLVQCPKCDTISIVTPKGLEKFVIKKTVVETDKKIEFAEVVNAS